MIVGIPKERKANETRVGMTPDGVHALVGAGHRVLLERGAGEKSGFLDEQYQNAGATIIDDGSDLYATAELIVKVKEPQPEELGWLRPGQILFAFLHLAPEKALTEAMLARDVIAVAYETVQTTNGALPLLTPMSEIAGRMAVQVGIHFLEAPHGGRGVLVGGVPGVPSGDIVILGAGTVGSNALRVAVGLGANVTILDVNLDRLRYLEDLYGGRIVTVHSNPASIAEATRRADLLISSVLVPGARTPILVTEEMVKNMKPGSVIVDVAIDQGGAVATADMVSTHDNPVYERHGVLHYAVSNMPGAVPRTSTYALTNVTLPYVLKLANKGVEVSVRDDPALRAGVNLYRGRVVHAAVADALGLPHHSLETVLNSTVASNV